MDQQLGVQWREQWQVIQREEALKKRWLEMQWGDVPDNLSELAESLRASGHDSDDIPDHISSPDEFHTWLTDIEAGSDDLDVWFGRSE